MNITIISRVISLNIIHQFHEKCITDNYNYHINMSYSIVSHIDRMIEYITSGIP